MFTGIVQAKGTLKRDGSRIFIATSLKANPGESIAVNGCCLTHVGGEQLTFDLTRETLTRTTLGELPDGAEVNLEPAIKAGSPMGGHFVLGHVDAVGELESRDGEIFRFEIPVEGAKYLVDKGSIAINGVSLTVIKPIGNEFSVALVPHTLKNTTFENMQPGTRVNVEYDILARYLERLLENRG